MFQGSCHQDFPPNFCSALSNASSSSDQKPLSIGQHQQIALNSQNADPYQVRPGDLCNTSVFQQFLQDWLKLFDIVLDSQVTPANEEERKRFENLLKAKKLSEKRTFYHCRLFLKNFYPSVFFGSGFGSTMRQSSFSAAKSLVTCLRESGLISTELFEVILREHLTLGRLNNTSNNTVARANKEKIDFSSDVQWLYSKRVTNAFIELVNKESFPVEFKEGALTSSDKFQEQMRLLILNFQSLKPKFGDTPSVWEERKRRLSDAMKNNADTAAPTASVTQNQRESPSKRIRPTSPFLDYIDPFLRTLPGVSPEPDDIIEEEEVVELQPCNPVQLAAPNAGLHAQETAINSAEATKSPTQTPAPFTFGVFNPNTSANNLFSTVSPFNTAKQLGPLKDMPNCSSSTAQLSSLSRLIPANKEKGVAKVTAGTPIWRSPANFKFAVAASQDNSSICIDTLLPPPPKPPVFDLSDEEIPPARSGKDDDIQILPPVSLLPQKANKVAEVAASSTRLARAREARSPSLERIHSSTNKKLQNPSAQALQAFNAEDLSDGEELFAVFSKTPNTQTPNGGAAVRPTTTITRLRGNTPSPPRRSSSKGLRPTSPLTTTNLVLHAKTVNRAAPVVINGGTATSSSSSSSTQLCDSRSNGAPIKGFNWREKYGVCPNTNCSAVYNTIAAYRERFKKEFNTFNKGIWNHLMNNLQNDETFAWKMRIRKELNNALCEVNPECLLIAVGSTINGCGAYNCDMDLCLCLPCPLRKFETERSYALSHLKRFKKRLMRLQVVKRVEYIPAKVPILKLWFNQPYEQLEVDLNVNNMPGIFNSYLLHYYSRIDDKFPALCLLVKHWAKRADINEASQGTFNSYSLILMVLHFLQVACDPPILPNLQKLYPNFFSTNLALDEIKIFAELPTPLPEAPRNTKSVGELLIAFFDYYVNFDYENVAISIARGKTFPRSELPRNTDRFKVFIEEPFDFQNTARCVTGNDEWELITEAFVEARNAFLNPNYPCPPTLQLLKIPPVF